LAGDDRCHLNGVALFNDEPTWASACGGSDGASSWRNNRTSGGVLIHIPSGELAATGLSMPHSPRWHNGRLWLLNSGSGELGWIEDGAFHPLCALPGFARGLAFADGCAVVGLSKLRSAQFTGLPLEERLAAEGMPGGCCGLRVIDLNSGTCLHSFDLPEPIDELFDVVVLPGVRQPRALGLQGEAIDCLVKLPDRPELVQVRPMAPSGKPHQGPAIRPFGLPEEGGSQRSAEHTSVRYQRVFHLSPANLAPYAALTFPSLAAGSSAISKLQGELLGLSAMANGQMVGLGLAERHSTTAAQVISLMVAPEWRGQGIGSHVLGGLSKFLAQEGVEELSIRYQTSFDGPGPVDRLLLRLGWQEPQRLFLLLEGQAKDLAAIPWPERFPLPPAYRLESWQPTHAVAATALGAPAELQAATLSSTIDQGVSLALFHGDALVGWLIVDRTSSASVRCSSLYVQPGHRIRGQALALLVEGFRRQQAAGIAGARAAIAPESAELIRLVHRNLGRWLVISAASGSSLSLG
jgi:GNAT superfamily N-acetyltransferase